MSPNKNALSFLFAICLGFGCNSAQASWADLFRKLGSATNHVHPPAKIIEEVIVPPIPKNTHPILPSDGLGINVVAPAQAFSKSVSNNSRGKSIQSCGEMNSRGGKQNFIIESINPISIHRCSSMVCQISAVIPPGLHIVSGSRSNANNDVCWLNIESESGDFGFIKNESLRIYEYLNATEK